MPFINKTPGLPLVAHNGNMFDMPVIKSCCKYFGMPLPQLEYFDSLIVARKTWPEMKNHQLTFLGEQFNIEYRSHDALEDSRTCGKLIKIAADKWEVGTVQELLGACKTGVRTFD